MEHPLNGQYVLTCQLSYYKLCWAVYSYFISFMNLFLHLLHASIFVCQAAVRVIVALQAELQCKCSKGRRTKRRRTGEGKKSVKNMATYGTYPKLFSVCVLCSLNLIVLVNVTLLPSLNAHIMRKCV